SAATSAAILSLIIGIVAALLISLVAGVVLSRSIATSILGLISEMKRLVGGDTSIGVPQASRKDEIGQMGVALIAFRDAAIEKNRIEAEALANRSQSEIERAASEAEKARVAAEDAVAITALGEGLSAIADGDLTHRFTAQVAARSEGLKTNFNTAVVQLQDTMSVVVTNVSAIRSGSGEISQAADDLSRRTEQQAASLEETAAALDEITATVNRTASGARQASDTVQAAKGDAETSGNVVRDAVTAMGAIEKSSQEISQIIGVIDEIAFQTNLLALNAGVEAARAGDAGRGFAVVASEVRALAQRSAEAAKEIKVLISASSTQVKTGVSLVGQTGEALQRIVSRVAEIDGLVSEIAASAQEQATGLQQVNTAVNQMDQVTQQNAAMVEESTAASHSLSQEAESLASSVARFNIGAQNGAQGGVRAAQPARPAPRPVHRPAQPAPSAHRPVAAMRTLGHGGAARRPEPAAADEGWEEF
ncbi:MAG TPA: methyl-accepting chemotaxis protein, partial [Brevundimonas sp.]